MQKEIKLYKIYVGDFVKDGKPNTWTITGSVPRVALKNHIHDLLKAVKPGMEIYVLTPEDVLHAVFRENLKKKFN